MQRSNGRRGERYDEYSLEYEEEIDRYKRQKAEMICKARLKISQRNETGGLQAWIDCYKRINTAGLGIHMKGRIRDATNTAKDVEADLHLLNEPMYPREFGKGRKIEAVTKKDIFVSLRVPKISSSPRMLGKPLCLPSDWKWMKQAMRACAPCFFSGVCEKAGASAGCLAADASLSLFGTEGFWPSTLTALYIGIPPFPFPLLLLFLLFAHCDVDRDLLYSYSFDMQT